MFYSSTIYTILVYFFWQVQVVHEKIRNWLSDNVSADVAQNVRIIHGGPVTGENYKNLAKGADIDGFLLHNLDPSTFTVSEEGEYLIARIVRRMQVIGEDDEGKREFHFEVMDADGVIKRAIAIGAASSIFYETLDKGEVYKFFDVGYLDSKHCCSTIRTQHDSTLLFSYQRPPQKINRYSMIDPRLCRLDYPLVFNKLRTKKKRFLRKSKRKPASDAIHRVPQFPV